jgi:hypothetical protein
MAGKTANNEMGWPWEVDMTKLKAPSWHLPAGNEVSHKPDPQPT